MGNTNFRENFDLYFFLFFKYLGFPTVFPSCLDFSDRLTVKWYINSFLCTKYLVYTLRGKIFISRRKSLFLLFFLWLITMSVHFSKYDFTVFTSFHLVIFLSICPSAKEQYSGKETTRLFKWKLSNDLNLFLCVTLMRSKWKMKSWSLQVDQLSYWG